MAKYEFKLPDIGEGIAEAEIVAWHVKLGDRVEEDQQLADMMTDKATVEMETPVAGKVVKLAGEVGDQIAIGSVLVVIETDGDAAGADASESRNEVPMADGAAEATAAQEEAMPITAVEDEPPPVRPERSEAQSKGAGTDTEPRPSTSLRTNGCLSKGNAS
jgi:2-oxoisovalerate dehydrogenase E2 component (dihydrolipoyl transacylase)